MKARDWISIQMLLHLLSRFSKLSQYLALSFEHILGLVSFLVVRLEILVMVSKQNTFQSFKLFSNLSQQYFDSFLTKAIKPPVLFTFLTAVTTFVYFKRQFPDIVKTVYHHYITMKTIKYLKRVLLSTSPRTHIPTAINKSTPHQDTTHSLLRGAKFHLKKHSPT